MANKEARQWAVGGGQNKDHGLQTTDHEDGAGGEQETQTRDGSILAKLDEVSSALARIEQYLPGFMPKPAATPASGSHGRLQWANDFKEIRLGGVLYDLAKRPKARFCIKFLMAWEACDEVSARNLETEIDPYVRAQAKMKPLPKASQGNLRIHHYFNTRNKKYNILCNELIKSAGNGRFYLHTQ